MILEHAVLTVRPGAEAEFEAAFSQAREVIALMRGFHRLSLGRCVEAANVYLLLVEWDSLEDHTVGFRGSPEYQTWRALLHRFYEPLPTVEHFTTVQTAEPAS